MEMREDPFDIFNSSVKFENVQNEKDILFEGIADPMEVKEILSTDTSESNTIETGLLFLRQKLTIINE